MFFRQPDYLLLFSGRVRQILTMIFSSLSPMPLAVKKLTLADLPVALTLSDADAMMPTMKLSSFRQVVVGARVSTSGNPVAQAGDFYTELEAIDSANPPAEISLTIDQIK